jgi:hypothetical protein
MFRHQDASHPQGIFLINGTQTKQTNLDTLVIPMTVTQCAADWRCGVALL